MRSMKLAVSAVALSLLAAPAMAQLLGGGITGGLSDSAAGGLNGAIPGRGAVTGTNAEDSANVAAANRAGLAKQTDGNLPANLAPPKRLQAGGGATASANASANGAATVTN